MEFMKNPLIVGSLAVLFFSLQVNIITKHGKGMHIISLMMVLQLTVFLVAFGTFIFLKQTGSKQQQRTRQGRRTGGMCTRMGGCCSA